MTGDQMNLDDVLGKYAGHDATPTEWAAGADHERKTRGPIKPGKNEHRILMTYEKGKPQTAYHASYIATHGRSYHSLRRESTRLEMRGFLVKVKDERVPNPDPACGGKNVELYLLTDSGVGEQARLGPLP